MFLFVTKHKPLPGAPFLPKETNTCNTTASDCAKEQHRVQESWQPKPADHTEKETLL